MSEREAFEEWCRLNCSPRAESSDWYWRIFQAGAAWQRSTAAQPTAYCRYCGVPDGDGHTADCQHPSLASQPNVEPLLNALADAALECDEELDAAIQEDMERMRRVADQPSVCSYTGPLVPNEFGRLACPECGVIPSAADNGSAG